MKNFELNPRAKNEPADDSVSDRATEAVFVEVQCQAGATSRSMYIIDTGGSEVSALNDW